MSLVFSLLTLGLVGGSLILITLALRSMRPSPADSTNTLARFFLIGLRVAIGWHCFVEGMEKLSMPNWSGEAYLRESIGPLSGIFRGVAGDRLLERVDTGAIDAFPAALERDWRIHLDAFAAHYELDDSALKRAQGILDQRKQDTLTTFQSKSQTVTKISAYTPELKLQMTMKERVAEHQRLAQRVDDLEAKFPTSDKAVHAAWKNAKADLTKWRGGMKTALDAETAEFKKALLIVLPDEYRSKDPKVIETLKPPLKEPVAPPISSWQMLDWSDLLVKYSLVVLGMCLMLGLLSRISCVATALLVFSFYLALPALPGWPESPRLEGHYLLVNKTLIEVIALCALACLPTGVWAGLDGLLCLCCWRKTSSPAKLPETPVQS